MNDRLIQNESASNSKATRLKINTELIKRTEIQNEYYSKTSKIFTR